MGARGVDPQRVGLPHLGELLDNQRRVQQGVQAGGQDAVPLIHHILVFRKRRRPGVHFCLFQSKTTRVSSQQSSPSPWEEGLNYSPQLSPTCADSDLPQGELGSCKG